MTVPAAIPPAQAASASEAPAPRAPTDHLRRAMRTQIMVLSFYLVDALLMAGYAVHGALPPVAPIAFGAAGFGLTGLFAVMVRMGLHRRMGGAVFTTLQLLSACSLMLVTAAALPQIGMLLLLTLIVALATAALQMPLRHVLAVTGLIAAFSLALLLSNGNRFRMPLDDGWLRLLSGLWFAVVLAKIVAINLIGAQMRKALSASNSRLEAALTQVRELSERDELTGLQNRRSILALLTEERARFSRGGLAFGVAILDIDHFKRVNDRHGHAMGDEVLRAFAKIVAGRLRSTDRIARYGGEEFLLLLTNSPEAPSAQLAVERLRCAVAEYPWSDLAAELQVTCSIGLTMSCAGEGVAEMLERADAALYRAKSDGRNAVRVG
ncbi:MAG TPA: GGDEF domain-containing protein [Piscinibacter sp.]|nr:GGDEF domain-containing protein [Piscinibacter sp.]HPM66358.1 GGDEF domain-containing protein [Piscinibacter sp.]